MKDISAEMAAALAAARDQGLVPRQFILVEAIDRSTGLPFDRGFWSGDDVITIGVPDRNTGVIVNHDFIGAQNLNIGPIPRVSDLTIQTVTVDLSQIAIAVQEIAREYDLRLAKADIYEVTFDPLTKIASANPEVVFMGEVNGNPFDTPAVGDEGSIQLELNSDAISMLNRTNPSKSSFEGQKRRSGDEWGLYSSTLSSWNVPWGQKAS
ncbi:hypothetical protein [Phyllobacterium sp. P5_D12]